MYFYITYDLNWLPLPLTVILNLLPRLRYDNIYVSCFGIVFRQSKLLVYYWLLKVLLLLITTFTIGLTDYNSLPLRDSFIFVTHVWYTNRVDDIFFFFLFIHLKKEYSLIKGLFPNKWNIHSKFINWFYGEFAVNGVYFYRDILFASTQRLCEDELTCWGNQGDIISWIKKSFIKVWKKNITDDSLTNLFPDISCILNGL